MTVTNPIGNGTNGAHHGVSKPLHHAMQASLFQHGVSVGHAHKPFGVLAKVAEGLHHGGCFPFSLRHTNRFYTGKRVWMRCCPTINQVHCLVGRSRINDKEVEGKLLCRQVR